MQRTTRASTHKGQRSAHHVQALTIRSHCVICVLADMPGNAVCTQLDAPHMGSSQRQASGPSPTDSPVFSPLRPFVFFWGGGIRVTASGAVIVMWCGNRQVLGKW